MDAPPLMKPKRGRPRAAPGSSLSLYVRTVDHDRLVALAKRHEKSIAALVRDLLRLKL
jgi:hypothetical protein